MTQPALLPFPDLEQVYEALAQANDRAGPEHEALLLTKLALTLAHRIGDLDAFRAALAAAEQDLA